MKKLTLIFAAVMIAGSSFAHDCKGDKNCCKGKKADCKKEAKAGCKEKACCKKNTETAKK